MKFYKDFYNKFWIENETCPAGLYSISFSEDNTRCLIRNIATEIIRYNGLITGVLKENGTGYSNRVEIETILSDFFVSSDSTSIIAAIQNSGGTQLKAFHNTITRTVNTAYTAGDVVGTLLTIANVAKSNGTGVRITRVRIQTNDTGVAGKKFNVHIFNYTPANVPADNAPFAIDYTNAAKRIGAIPVVMGVGNLGTVGMNDYNILTLNPAARAVYVVLESVDGFTPSASSTEFQITIDCELSNN